MLAKGLRGLAGRRAGAGAGSDGRQPAEAFLQLGIFLGAPFPVPRSRRGWMRPRPRGSTACRWRWTRSDWLSCRRQSPTRRPIASACAAARGVTVAAVQGTFNMCHPDAAVRADGLRRLRVLAEACPRMNVPMIQICTGTRSRGSIRSRHPDNQSPEAWRDMTACVRTATQIARQAGVVLGFEPEVSNVVDSAKRARQLLDEIGSPHLKVTIDGGKLVPRR